MPLVMRSTFVYRFLILFSLAAPLILAGCGGKKSTRVHVPPPPEAPPSIDGDEWVNKKPIFTQEGLASWYGPPYHNRRAANGEIFDMHQLTAAHKTLPLNSVCRVTNLKNGQSVIVRINDRGPFVGERIIDLSMEAAKQIDLWRAGVAKVRVEVLQAPAPLDSGGRWAVQIGAFKDADDARKLKEKLQRRYHTAKVIQFSGPTGEWVRIRPLNDERSRASEVARDTHVSEGGVFLVRLD